MLTPRKQKGLTLISMVVVLAVVGFFAYTAMKLIPAYTEYFGVVKSMKAVADSPNASEASLEQLRRNLDTNFSVQYVDESSIPADGIKLETQGGQHKLRVVYDKKIPFLYNVSLLAHFDHSEDLTKSGSGY
jgi:hypothetical protein